MSQKLNVAEKYALIIQEHIVDNQANKLIMTLAKLVKAIYKNKTRK